MRGLLVWLLVAGLCCPAYADGPGRTIGILNQQFNGQVLVSGQSDGDVLTWQASTGKWISSAASGGGLPGSYTVGDLLYASNSSTLTKLTAGAAGLVLTSGGAATAPSWVSVGAMTVFGDGSDGAQTFDGSTTILGIVPSGNVYTLTKNLFLAGGSIVNSGVTILTAQYAVFCTGQLTINGTISNDGGAASGATGGAGRAVGLFGAISAGENGVTTATSSHAGGSTVGTTAVFSGASGGGGRSDGTQQLAGGAGSYASEPHVQAYLHNGMGLQSQSTVVSAPLFGPCGGVTTTNAGRGSGDGTNAGGGCGGTGGVIYIVAKNIVCGASVSIHANGGNGGNGAGGTAGGGGGGGGGPILIYATSYSGTALVSGTNVTSTPGNGGTGQGGAGNGTAGVAAAIFIITLL